MSGPRYSTHDSGTLAVQHVDNSFNYWLQQGQVAPLSQGALSPFSAPLYTLPSSHPAYPPVPHRPTSFSSVPTTSGACFPLSSPCLPNSSSRTLSQGTLYQEINDDSTESSSSPYLNSSNDTPPSGITSNSSPAKTPLDSRNDPCFGQSSTGTCPHPAFPGANSSLFSNQRQTGSTLTRKNQSSSLPTHFEPHRGGKRQHVPATSLSFTPAAWQPRTDINISNTLVAHGYGSLQFDNTFASNCTIQSQDLYSHDILPCETTENVKHSLAKRRGSLDSSPTSKRRRTSRRHRDTGSRLPAGSSTTRTVLQGASREDTFNVQIWHQVEGQPPRTVRSTFGPERRLEVAQVRERGACFNCRFSKQGVRRKATDMKRVLTIG